MEDYASAHNRVKQTDTIDEESLDGFQHRIGSLLRSLGLTTTLKKGIIHLLKPFTICSKENILTLERAKLSKLFYYSLAQFKMKVKAHWDKDSEQVQLFDLNEQGEDDDDQQVEDNDDEN